MKTAMRKYEFTGETKTLCDGTVLHRIRALIDIDLGWRVVKAGELGGWLEYERNLSHYGNCWVYGNAKVYGDAEVYGYADVYGNAEVCGNAVVCENAEVCGNAVVCGNAEVFSGAVVRGNANVCGDAHVFKKDHVLVIGPIGSRSDFTTFMRNKSGEILVKCGCFFGTADEFLTKVQNTHGDSKYTVVYRAAVALAVEQIDTNPETDSSISAINHIADDARGSWIMQRFTKME